MTGFLFSDLSTMLEHMKCEVFFTLPPPIAERLNTLILNVFVSSSARLHVIVPDKERKKLLHVTK
jgi:hypothetical protein